MSSATTSASTTPAPSAARTPARACRSRSTCDAPSEYGDPYTIMGSASTRHHNNWHRAQLGWASDTLTVATSGTYTLAPAELTAWAAPASRRAHRRHVSEPRVPAAVRHAVRQLLVVRPGRQRRVDPHRACDVEPRPVEADRREPEHVVVGVRGRPVARRSRDQRSVHCHLGLPGGCERLDPVHAGWTGTDATGRADRDLRSPPRRSA